MCILLTDGCSSSSGLSIDAQKPSFNSRGEIVLKASGVGAATSTRPNASVSRATRFRPPQADDQEEQKKSF